MAIESSLTREMGKTGGKKKSQSEWPSYELSSNNSKDSQGDSDSESTSVTSSIQGSTSSATSSLDHDSSTVKGGTKQSKTLQKSNSKKFASFGSFIKSSRRRAQSRLSQSSIKLSDTESTTPQDPSSIEVSDESANYSLKPMPKFTRTGSLRSVRIFKNKNKSSSKPKKSSINKNPEISKESHIEKATFSSILKDSKFPEHLKHQTGPLEPEEVLPVAKFCTYQHCSLHGHHHHHEPPEKRFPYLKRHTTKEQKITKSENQSESRTSNKKKETKVPKKVSKVSNRESNLHEDFSIEFYARTRSEPVIQASQGHDDADFADMLFGVNSFQEKNKEMPTSNYRSFIDLNEVHNGNLDGSKSVLENKLDSKKGKHMSMWRMIHPQMVSALTESSNTETKDFDDSASQETEIRKMFAIKLVREAIEKILLPEVQDDQSTTSEVISEQDLPEKNQSGSEITSDQKEETQATNDVGEEGETKEEPIEKKTEKRAPKSWSYLKKVILLTRFVKELEKVKKFNPKKPRHLPLAPEPEAETISLRRQTTGDKKNADEWMLDYALQKVVSELAPTQKRKVSLLVKAFETVAPQEPRSNNELKRVGSETKDKFQETNELSVESKADCEFKSRMTENIVSSSSFEKKNDPRFDFSAENRIKMWHMIYQHVVTDIATKVGSDLLLDGEESINGEEKNLQEVEDHNERNFKLEFTQSDAFKLVKESVDEILIPDDVNDSSLQETRSISSDLASDQDEQMIEPVAPTVGNRLNKQKSKNWSKLKKLIMLKRSIKALESFRKLKTKTPQDGVLISDKERERVDLKSQMVEERKKAEQWMLDYAVQHIVTKLTPARKKRVSMLVEAFEAVVPLPEI